MTYLNHRIVDTPHTFAQSTFLRSLGWFGSGPAMDGEDKKPKISQLLPLGMKLIINSFRHIRNTHSFRFILNQHTVLS